VCLVILQIVHLEPLCFRLRTQVDIIDVNIRPCDALINATLVDSLDSIGLSFTDLFKVYSSVDQFCSKYAKRLLS